MRILVLNGPNLNILGMRDGEYYGTSTLHTIELKLKAEFPGDIISFVQSNNEQVLITAIQRAYESYDGIIINPGGYSHTSVAIRDALEVCKLPKIEVHLSNIYSRDSFRQVSITAQKCTGCVSGLKEDSYYLGVIALKRLSAN